MIRECLFPGRDELSGTVVGDAVGDKVAFFSSNSIANAPLSSTSLFKLTALYSADEHAKTLRKQEKRKKRFRKVMVDFERGDEDGGSCDL